MIDSVLRHCAVRQKERIISFAKRRTAQYAFKIYDTYAFRCN